METTEIDRWERLIGKERADERKRRIKEIACEHFSEASVSDIQTWLRESIMSFEEKGFVSSFSPFQNFFGEPYDDTDLFADIINTLPNSKEH